MARKRTRRSRSPRRKAPTSGERKNRLAKLAISRSRIERKPYDRLTAREKATRERALSLLSDLRRGEESYGDLLRKYRLDTRTAHRYLGRNLLGGTGGKPVRASNADSLVRELLFPTSFGDVPVRIRSSRDATKLSEFLHDRDKLVHDKLSADEFEAKWSGVRVAGQEIFAEASAIFQMANAGELKVGNLYASMGSER